MSYAYSLPDFVRVPNPNVYLSDNYVCLDVETTNREYGTALDPRNSLLLARWTVGKDHKAFRGNGDFGHWGDEFSQSHLLDHVASASYIVCHNTKFELQWLKRMGMDLRAVLPFCTMIGEKVLHGNLKAPLSLEASAARRGLGNKDAVASLLIKSGVCPSNIPHDLLEQYCAQDVALTEALFLAQRRELQALNLLPVAWCRNIVTPVLADIEFNGMTLDPERVEATYNDYATRYKALSDEFSVFTGGVNFRSPKQLSEYLYDTLAFQEITDRRGNPERTAAGGRKTGKDVIPRLEATTEKQKEFKTLVTALTALKVPMQNLEKMQKVCKESPNDPRMYFSFNQTVTDTDRLSSSARLGGMQGQNIDRTFKRLFVSGARGRVVCESDGVQLEFRVACHLGRDRQGLEDILSGLDVHAVSAEYHGISRQAAKARTFRPLFGGKSGTTRERKYIDYFVKRYNGISGTQAKWALDAAHNKFITTETGYRFYFPEAEISGDGYIKGSTKIYNYPIQQTATADIIPLCLVLVWHLVNELGSDCRILNTIHDSIITDCGLDALDRYKNIVKWAFTDGVYAMFKNLYKIDITAPLGVEFKTATHWADTKEAEKYDPQVSILP